MRKIVKISMVAVFIACVSFLLVSCWSPRSVKGLDFLREHPAYSDYELTTVLFMETEFLDKYHYLDGDFIYEDKRDLEGTLARSFAWLSYDEETYQQAKQSRFDTRFDENAEFDGQEVFGFTFYLFFTNDGTFPHWFTAFGYDDERHILVFIGFYGAYYGSDETEKQYVNLAGTDLRAFLVHYFGSYYDWCSNCDLQS